ncbi:MAG: hypothetical protein RLZZ361_932, partial [Cyanobacteriota bacterium]
VNQTFKNMRYPSLINHETEIYLIKKNLLKQKVKKSPNKGFIYFTTCLISAFFLGFIFWINSLSDLQISIISLILDSIPFFDFKLSVKLIDELNQSKPAISTLLTANLLFLGFIVVDLFRKDEILSDGSKDLFKESSSASFALHTLILLLMLLSLLLTWHPRPQVKITTIEFVPTQASLTKKPPKNTLNKSNKQSINSGKNNPKQKVLAPSGLEGKPSLPPSPPKTTEAKPGPKAIVPKPKQISELPNPSQNLNQKALPAPAPVTNKIIAGPRPKPIREALIPLTGTASQTSSLPRLMDYGSANSSESKSSAGGAPGPKNSSQSGANGTRGNDLVSRLSNIPRAPDAVSGTGDGGNDGTPSNPPPNSYPNLAPSLASQSELNMGPYMSALQRKIKRAWKPPRGTESNRIVANFKVHRNGTITDLKLIVQCSYPEANLAALEAISNAAPFEILPAGSVDPVDIEFTFDYNVFQKARW